ncbi:hypothetical protein VSDG_06335 [Cytospora chrysosperma]|uniref:Uncharacterized protein n=1 Tax=Cytospora chrysosperma TaxID=252740 RepID=A0A423VPC2_CYTCH|nr:hypothetical protein VSDG_06335 [Valsa sordida]
MRDTEQLRETTRDKKLPSLTLGDPMSHKNFVWPERVHGNVIVQDKRGVGTQGDVQNARLIRIDVPCGRSEHQ